MERRIPSQIGVSLLVSAFVLASPGARAEVPPALDPELAAAFAADQAAREAAPPALPSPPVGGGAGMRQMNPDLSFILDTTAAWYSDPAWHLRQGGHAADETGVTLQGVELAASASVDPYFRFDLYFQLGHLHLEEAVLTTLALPAGLQARAGFFNAAFGRENPQHLHSWNLVNPSLAHGRFLAEEHFAGAGGELSWLLPLPWYLLATVDVFDSSSRAGLRSSTFGASESTSSGLLDGPEKLVTVGRLESFGELGPDWSLALGLSGAWGLSPHVPDNRATLYGADCYLKWRPIGEGRGALFVALTVEAVLRDTQVPGDSVRDAGGYAQLDVQLSQRWLVTLRGETVGWLSGPTPDPRRAPADDQRRASLGLTFLPTHFSKLRLQGDLQTGPTGGSGEAGAEERTGVAVFLQTEISAGEHGAHRF
ncbi:MAG: hypothetical protein RBU45_25360 [Myxococcota bacterium]|jgi:hypothetical protein|nr:hypothetical protein [Myxococcota bacterium]